MRKDWYPTQDAKRAAFLENFVATTDKARGIRHAFASTHAETIASAKAWPKTRRQRLPYAPSKGCDQPTGGQKATLSVVADMPVAALAC